MRFSLDKSFGIADVIARSLDIDFSDGYVVRGIMACGATAGSSNHGMSAVMSLPFDKLGAG